MSETAEAAPGGVIGGSEVLAFERRNPQRGALKDARIRAQLGLSAARYYQVLHRVVDTREALSEDPVLVHRLVRVRDRRTSPFDIRGQDGA